MSTLAPATAAPLVVTCRLASQSYALPLAAVLQVVRLPALVPLAGAPPTLCGLLNLRGELLPVLAGRTLFGLPMACDLASQVLIVAGPGGRPALGLLVDEVYQVRSFASECFTPLDQGSALICGALRGAAETCLLIDPEILVATARGAAGRDD